MIIEFGIRIQIKDLKDYPSNFMSRGDLELKIHLFCFCKWIFRVFCFRTFFAYLDP